MRRCSVWSRQDVYVAYWKMPKIGQVWRPVGYSIRNRTSYKKVEQTAEASYAIGLQRGVNSISAQCIPWPVACSEWGACLTDFRFQIFRFQHPDYDPDRAQKLTSSSMSRHLSTRKISSKYMRAFFVILLTDRQTNIAGNRIYLLLCRR